MNTVELQSLLDKLALSCWIITLYFRVCKVSLHNLSMAQGLLFATSGGLIVNKIISTNINITNEESKNKIKDIENY